jgi:hypothetical protein
MKIIKSAFTWLAGSHSTGITGTTDHLTDNYRKTLATLVTPNQYTTENVRQATARAAWSGTQVYLAKLFHDAQRQTIENLGELDSLTTRTAQLYSDTAVEISDRRSKAQEKILVNEVRGQLNDTRLNALKQHMAQGLKL